MTLLLQLAVLCALLTYLWHCRSQMRRRNLRSWESLVARAGKGFGDLSDQFSGQSADPSSGQSSGQSSDQSADPSFQQPAASKRSRKRTSRSLWALFVRAGVVLELADYAERNSAAAILDPLLLASLRRDAMQIRISALIGIAKCALPQLAA